MTAAELIEKLSNLPPDSPILVEGYENGCDDIHDLQTVEVFRYSGAQAWDGEYQTDGHFRSRKTEPFPAIVIRGRRGPLR